MNPVMTVKALREYRRNFTRRGMLIIVRRRWQGLIFHPDEEYAKACALSEGAFS